MKSLRIMLSVVLMSLATVAFAQSDAQKSANKPAPSEAQTTSTQLKKPRGYLARAGNSCPAAARVGGRDVHAYLAARNVQGKRARARDAGSRNAVGSDALRPSGHDALCGWRSPAADSLLRRRQPAADGRPDLARRKEGGIRFSRRLRRQSVRTHAPCGFHRARCQPSHRGLDVY